MENFKILIVDDNLDFVFLVQEMLKGTQYDSAYARSATEALDLAKNTDFDAYILDLNLPDYTGYYLGTKLREIYEDCTLAVLTNYDGEVSRENARLINAEFWYKPNMVTNRKHFLDNLQRLVTYGEKKRVRNIPR